MCVCGMSRIWRTGGRFDFGRIRKASRSHARPGGGTDACAMVCGLGHTHQRPVRGFFHLLFRLLCTLCGQCESCAQSQIVHGHAQAD